MREVSQSISDKNETKALYQLIGFIVVHWSLLEQSLDDTSLTVFKACGGNTIKPRVPPNLEGKLKFLHQSFCELSTLSVFKSRGLQIIERVNKLAGKRNELIHGAITNLKSENGGFVFAKYDYNKERAKLRKVTFSVNDFQQLSQDIPTLAFDSAQLSHQIQQTFLPPKPSTTTSVP